jgi:hypothetical protein
MTSYAPHISAAGRRDIEKFSFVGVLYGKNTHKGRRGQRKVTKVLEE